MTRIPLTEKEIKEIRYQCRMGYIIPALIFGIGNLFLVFSYMLDLNYVNYIFFIFSEMGIITISILLSYLMNNKYWKDIKNNEKIVEPKIIQNKESKKDYEAGSGTLYIEQKMNEFEAFSIIVENVRYRVDKDFFNNCEIGQKVWFNYGSKSKFLLGISLDESV